MAKKHRPKAKRYPEVKPFRLLDLPPEIWSKIGMMAIEDTPPCTNASIASAKSPPTRHRTFKSSSPDIPTPAIQITCNLSVPLTSQQPPITRVCRVLREELLSQYYRTKVRLSLVYYDAEASTMGKWLRSIGPENRRLVNRVGIALSPWECSVPHGPEGAGALEQMLKRDWKVDVEIELGPSTRTWFPRTRRGNIELL
ncbi:hypothetical protein CLAFUW4_03886 [Fulvia fulva]|uniref:Uncharacterized protein n=1 Tax=Passalora fulva TaxID=5499 RepID=A0A9Q8P591_PASFU|nr:uncharacterized protein CLAFUR5_03856 [Fulvia fulva]KAK4631876.1 hypothetical protein CLAFUR4_03874 [Fulvia fulva]KAK4633305.1 hypothetical protein CLAFUR0_03873 [Fulvia fulva]UJO13679.1 hypothetical protein CLAFUR5_03856 [Fulvia fulva]WPV11043.1 hypothetical protein CLAFUW4_03886 [Fulvia fulva]WPV26672.1 hypothetical protein CLAFUW7_03877 [Fulvia fulva]